MYCENCGAKIEEGANFCQSCGKTVGITNGNSKQNNQTGALTQADYRKKKIWAVGLPIAILIGTIALWGIASTLSQTLLSIISVFLPIVVGMAIFWIPLGVLAAIYFHRRQKQEGWEQYDRRSGLGKDAPIPDEVKKWNWGAFVLTAVWGTYHGVWRSLLIFIPFFNIIWFFVLGAKGSEWAWQRNKYKSIEDFKVSKKRWDRAGIIILLIIIPLYIIGGILGSL